jgi:glutathione S-transferase
MILIGQYDSPFVRRVGIALRLYGIPFEHRPWSTFADAGKIRPFSPVTRVPVLALDDGDVLIESHAILDYIDSLVPAQKRLFPVREPARRRALKVAALACNVSDKAVALFYEEKLHREVSDLFASRCRTQIDATLAALEESRAAAKGPFWFGADFGHADIVAATMLRHLAEAHPGLAPIENYPALKAHAARMEAMPVFQEISQVFIPPA